VFNETEIKQIVAISVLLAATKVTKFGPRWGSSRRSPGPGWGGGHPLPITRADLGGQGGHTPKMPNIVQHDTEKTQCWCALQ